jgi:hypothetical protein
LRAHLAENLGDQEHMRADLERAAAGFRELGDSWALGMTLSSQASTLTLSDDLDAAETVLDEATELLETLGSGGAFLWLRLSDIRIRRGDFAGARELVQRAVENADVRRDEAVFIRAILARIAWLERDIEGMREIVAEGARRLEGFSPVRPEQGHAQAFILALRAILALEDGDLQTAETLVTEAVETAVATTDMPVVAMVGIVVAELSVRSGRVEDAAEQLGAAVVLRGAEDRSNPEVARLLAATEGHEPAYERGRALDRDAAIARLQPSGAPAVGA